LFVKVFRQNLTNKTFDEKYKKQGVFRQKSLSTKKVSFVKNVFFVKKGVFRSKRHLSPKKVFFVKKGVFCEKYGFVLLKNIKYLLRGTP